MYFPVFLALLLSIYHVPNVICDQVDCVVGNQPCNASAEGVQLTPDQYACCPDDYSMILANTCRCISRSHVSWCLTGEDLCENSTQRVIIDNRRTRCCFDDENLSTYTAYPLGVPTTMCRCFGSSPRSRRISWWNRQRQLVRNGFTSVRNLVRDTYRDARNLADDVRNRVNNLFRRSNSGV